jgi:hypothetical protein
MLRRDQIRMGKLSSDNPNKALLREWLRLVGKMINLAEAGKMEHEKFVILIEAIMEGDLVWVRECIRQLEEADDGGAQC